MVKDCDYPVTCKHCHKTFQNCYGLLGHLRRCKEYAGKTNSVKEEKTRASLGFDNDHRQENQDKKGNCGFNLKERIRPPFDWSIKRRRSLKVISEQDQDVIDAASILMAMMQQGVSCYVDGSTEGAKTLEELALTDSERLSPNLIVFPETATDVAELTDISKSTEKRSRESGCEESFTIQGHGDHPALQFSCKVSGTDDRMFDHGCRVSVELGVHQLHDMAQSLEVTPSTNTGLKAASMDNKNLVQANEAETKQKAEAEILKVEIKVGDIGSSDSGTRSGSSDARSPKHQQCTSAVGFDVQTSQTTSADRKTNLITKVYKRRADRKTNLITKVYKRRASCIQSH